MTCSCTLGGFFFPFFHKGSEISTHLSFSPLRSFWGGGGVFGGGRGGGLVVGGVWFFFFFFGGCFLGVFLVFLEEGFVFFVVLLVFVFFLGLGSFSLWASMGFFFFFMWRPAALGRFFPFPLCLCPTTPARAVPTSHSGTFGPLESLPPVHPFFLS